MLWHRQGGLKWARFLEANTKGKVLAPPTFNNLSMLVICKAVRMRDGFYHLRFLPDPTIGSDNHCLRFVRVPPPVILSFAERQISSKAHAII